MLVFVAFNCSDNNDNLAWMAKKLTGLRIFDDENDQLNLSVEDIRGEILTVSQFTLYGDCKKGKRPSYTDSLGSEQAKPLFDSFVNFLKQTNIRIQAGQFGAKMLVKLDNNGPVTLIIDR